MENKNREEKRKMDKKFEDIENKFENLLYMYKFEDLKKKVLASDDLDKLLNVNGIMRRSIFQ
jgi:beta-N-acetylglucosaminidase